GGVSVEGLSKEFKPLLRQIGAPNTVRFYDLRGSCNTEMERSHVSYLVQRYVTGHEIGRDIMSEYVTLGHAVDEVQKYFQSIQPLLIAIERRAAALGITREVRTAG